MARPSGADAHAARSTAPPIRRGARERAAAWLVTGPLGHLYGTLADIAGFAASRAAHKARERVRGTTGGR